MMPGDPQRQVPVSVVIPCYRCRHTIQRAVESVAAQTALPAEVILVDDGSGDGTLESLETLAAAHPPGWVKVVALPENGGAASARNKGWELAIQPYLAFLDADDAWHPRKIELQYGFMAAHPEVGLSAHRHEQLNHGGIPVTEIDGYSVQAISKLSLLLSNRFFAPTVMMLKRDLPHRYLPGRRHVDDHLLWLQILLAGFPFVRLSAKLAFTYKEPYGESGLSSQLWMMEKAELENYRILHSSGRIGVFTFVFIGAYSFAKFLRRLVVVYLRRPGR